LFYKDHTSLYVLRFKLKAAQAGHSTKTSLVASSDKVDPWASLYINIPQGQTTLLMHENFINPSFGFTLNVECFI
jgi:hypothetical protein